MEAAIEGLDDGIIGWVDREREVQDYAALVSPEVHVARDEVAALLYADGLGIAGRLALPVERRHDNFTRVAVAHVEQGQVTRESGNHETWGYSAHSALRQAHGRLSPIESVAALGEDFAPPRGGPTS